MILLSFDIEEFDMPLEYQGTIDFQEQISVSAAGLVRILDLLKKHNAKATFFSTVVFAQNNKELVQRLLAEGHELASHTWFHSKFETEDLEKSRKELANIFNVEINGLRMPRMMEIPAEDVIAAGYKYNSSVNPTFLPGRYNNLNVSRTYFREKGLLQIPASVSPWRIPLFWLSFHNFPTSVYRYFAMQALKKDGYLNVYFHPWEFMDISKPTYKLPGFTTKNTGDIMVERFDAFLNWLSLKNYYFATFAEFINRKIK